MGMECSGREKQKTGRWRRKKTMKRKSVETVFCKDCSKLETKANPKPFCPYLGAFIKPELLSQPWECEGYKPKIRRTDMREEVRYA
jgi:hypothetical protein